MTNLSYVDIYEKLLASQSEFTNPLTNKFTKMPTNLLCLEASEEYQNADFKVMVFGQETNGWEGDFKQTESVEDLLEVYRRFHNSGNCYKRGGHFFNGVAKVKSALTTAYAPQGKSVSFIWNNIIKIGLARKKGKPPGDILKWSAPTFELIRQELAFFKPDAVLFFTGPCYDEFLKQAFPDIEYAPVATEKTQRELSRVSSAHLPAKAIRTYHPNYLWRTKKPGFYGYCDLITAELSGK